MDLKQKEKIQASYDKTVEDFLNGISPLSAVPNAFKRSKKFRHFLKDTDPAVTGSEAPEIREFLQPSEGEKLLDVGCCANLATKRFDKWPALYFGIDISPSLIQAMRTFTREADITIGGLEVAEMTALPYPDSFFDLAMVIGVFEYVDMDYARSAVRELARVLKPGARLVADLPNPDHPHLLTMFRLEEYLGRPNILKSRTSFEKILSSCFRITRMDDSQVMIKFFMRKS
ncbi:MAG: class I SAM-dependent methyltransferase [Candidatus Aminicenantes bacterium]|nr:class I SAM-dependent methyltransferase [Candidatus Aminicenantes bacterium]